MKKIFRLTESELRHLIRESVNRVLTEQDGSFLLQSIAQSIISQGRFDVTDGENDGEFELQGGDYVHVTFNVECDPFIRKGMKSSSYDVPDDDDEIIDNPIVEVGSIDYYSERRNDWFQIRDNGLVKKALEKVIYVNYPNYNDIPSEEDVYYYED